jgi:outer membrane protein assembly factor BamB
VASGGTATDSVLWPADSIYRVSVILRDQRGTIAPAAGTRLVKVSLIAVLWYHLDDWCSIASPTLRPDGSSFQVIVNNNEDSLFCYRPDGSVKWMDEEGAGPYYSVALSEDGTRLYAPVEGLGPDYELCCLESETGRLAWRRADVDFVGTPALGPGGAIYVYDRVRQELLRLADDGDSCRTVWAVALPGDPHGSLSYPAVGSDGTVYLPYHPDGVDSTALAAVAPDGSVLWSRNFDRGTENDLAPIIGASGRIILVDDEDGVFCLNPDGSIAWRQPEVNNLPGAFSTAVGPDGRIYVVTFFPKLVCLEPDAGRILWDADLNREMFGGAPIVLDDGRILVHDALSDNAMLMAFDRDGTELWSFAALESLGIEKSKRAPRRDEYEEGGAPVVGPDGNLYLGSEYMGLWCLSFGDARIASGGWPTYNHDQSRSGWAGRH